MPPAQPDAPAHENRLAGESSPYLLQHARNPVDWYPWGPEAFEAARERGVPIFLSIGYATCYWCHVMERESFEDPAAAKIMNELFVCVKVDREQRPDVDDVYMTATQTMTGGGGWPMSVFLTPPGALGERDAGLMPFYAGTYFPPEPAHGRPSFTQVLTGVSGAWHNNRDEVTEQAQRLTEAVRSQLEPGDAPAVRLGTREVADAITNLIRLFDDAEGGFGGAPKFPQPVFLELLLDALPTLTDETERRTVERAIDFTLDRMAVGGLFDQAGGGFHRYCVDATWTVPHFEKMLYDNAQLLRVYARRAEQTGDALHRRTAVRTAQYLMTEMTGAAGGFHSAQDAEADGREGSNYTWTRQELGAALQGPDLAFAVKAYDFDEGPNFNDPHHPDHPSRVLRLADTPDAVALKLGMDADAFIAQLDRIHAKLVASRSRRPQPILDDKAIASWNGMAIAALADASRLLGEASWLDHARRAMSFVLAEMRTTDGGPIRDVREGVTGAPGVLEDSAWVARALIALHEAGAEEIDGRPTLVVAREILEDADNRFGDSAGSYFDTEAGRADLIVRSRSSYDGATPSGLGVMANNWIDLFEASGDARDLDRGAGVLAGYSERIARSPVATVNGARALLRLLLIDDSAIERAGMVTEIRSLPDDPPVAVYADAERVELDHGETKTVTLEVRIEDGYHVNAHEPGVDGLIGFAVEVGGGAGITIKPGYPEGDAYTGGAIDAEMGELRVYGGTVRVPVEITRVGEYVGEPRLLVTYQACDDSACYEPVASTLGLTFAAE